MRTQINTMNIEAAYREVEIKSAVCIGLDYGFEIDLKRMYRGTIVKLEEIYTDGKREWDIVKVVIQFLNDCNINDNMKNKIRVFKEKVDVKGDVAEREKEMEDIFDTWGEALEHIMKIVWSIDNAE